MDVKFEWTQAKSAVLGWIILHGLFLTVILSRDSTLVEKFRSKDLPYVICYTLILVLDMWTYLLIVRMKPGWAREYYASDESESTQSLLENHENTLEAGFRVCKYCSIQQPLRTKHCKVCHKCILKFDHHCFWIGQCVGERNHFVFLVYLVVESVTCIWTVFLMHSAFTEKESIQSWLDSNALVLFGFILLIGFTILPFSLCLYHIYLAMTNQTTWEQMRRSRIEYLKDVPENVFPFSQGILENFRTFFLAWKLSPICWKLPSNEEIQLRATSVNICSNQYYDCF
mmetsp:Transcript_41784/g.67787  ORF Transcript_41784/g.67787 Transcript_41784/m.67787 type:complete len:285 (-) Transcript_41784:81-935(-)